MRFLVGIFDLSLPYLYMTDRFASTPRSSILDELRYNYRSQFYGFPEPFLNSSWAGSIDALQGVIPDGVRVAMEYSFPIGQERIDFLLIGSKRALIIEMKGWNKYARINDYLVDTDIGVQLQPCYQLENYVAKFTQFHSASATFSFDSCVLMYKTTDGNDCEIFYSPSDLQKKVDLIVEHPPDDRDIDAIVNGRFIFSRTLIDFVRNNRESLLQSPRKTLLSNGFGMSPDQGYVMGQVMEALEQRRKKIFLIRGTMGSGKTLVALALLFTAISKDYHAILGYRNNRLINTLRRSVDARVRDLLQFYSTGMYGKGIGEPNFDISRIRGGLDLVIYDEAQRMTEAVMKLSMQRSPVSVYFYDENQILIGDEEGTRNNFIRNAEELGIEVQEIEFGGIFRIRGGRQYERFLDSLFDGENQTPPDIYDFKVFDSFERLLGDLEKRKTEISHDKVALVASFTESDGRKNKVRVEDPRIEWLMDEKTEYPEYWINQKDVLKKCASIYGSQGFEADYVGVIWGRDLTWRGKWTVNPGAITDGVGNHNSLKRLAVTDRAKAMQLLLNRYRILMTRGIKGTYVYFEDAETGNYVKSRISPDLIIN